MAHGAFDGPEAVCPQGCDGTMVVRAYRTAPSIQSRGYRGINRSFETLARENGLTDMHNRDGQGMRRADRHTHERLRQQTEMIVQSGDRKGMDVSQVFQPMSNFRPGSTGGGGAIQRDGGQITVGGVPLERPRHVVEYAHDGRNAGLPAGDS